jgi:hypothetical protein
MVTPWSRCSSGHFTRCKACRPPFAELPVPNDPTLNHHAQDLVVIVLAPRRGEPLHLMVCSTKYPYRAAYKAGTTFDFPLWACHDEAATGHNFEEVIDQNVRTRTRRWIRAVSIWLPRSIDAKRIMLVTIRRNNYMNNIVKHDNRAARRIAKPMMGRFFVAPASSCRVSK